MHANTLADSRRQWNNIHLVYTKTNARCGKGVAKMGEFGSRFV